MSIPDTLADVENCVDRLIADFLEHPHLVYSEDTIHSRLYHLLTQARVNKSVTTTAGYLMDSVQNEYPPVLPEPGSRRGLYDLVVFSEEQIKAIDNWNHWRAGKTNLGTPAPPLVAVEIGLDKGLSQSEGDLGSRLAEAEKELARLDDSGNRVDWPLLLYFYKYPSHDRDSMAKILAHFKNRGTRSKKTDLFVIASGFDQNRKFQVTERNELRIKKGLVVKREGPLFSR
jgi:hypothetical protein